MEVRVGHEAESAAERLAHLRAMRGPRDRDDSAAGMFRAEGTRLSRLARQVGGVAEAWEAVCPPQHASRTRVISVLRGVLTIGVADASTRWELERELKGGADRRIIARCPMTVRRIKLVSDADAADPHIGAESAGS